MISFRFSSQSVMTRGRESFTASGHEAGSREISANAATGSGGTPKGASLPPAVPADAAAPPTATDALEAGSAPVPAADDDGSAGEESSAAGTPSDGASAPFAAAEKSAATGALFPPRGAASAAGASATAPRLSGSSSPPPEKTSMKTSATPETKTPESPKPRGARVSPKSDSANPKVQSASPAPGTQKNTSASSESANPKKPSRSANREKRVSAASPEASSARRFSSEERDSGMTRKVAFSRAARNAVNFPFREKTNLSRRARKA